MVNKYWNHRVDDMQIDSDERSVNGASGLGYLPRSLKLRLKCLAAGNTQGLT